MPDAAALHLPQVGYLDPTDGWLLVMCVFWLVDALAHAGAGRG